MKPPLLTVQNLKKYFPITAGFFRREKARLYAVNDVSFSMFEGEILGMVGESGCGKSTIGRCLLRLQESSGGEILFQGNHISRMKERQMRRMRRDIQMIFQDPYASLSPRKTVAGNIGEALLYHGLAETKEERDHMVREVLKKVGLAADVMNRYPHEFSGGQQQRICIARALVLKPKLIVCDEVVSALDVSVQAQILHLLKQLQQEMNLSYLFISHDLSVVRYLCDRVLVLYLGRIVEEGECSEVFTNPQHPYTQALLSAIPKNHPKEKRQRILISGEPPSPLSPPSGCPFRTRCPIAKPVCAEKFPPLYQASSTHAHHCELAKKI